MALQTLLSWFPFLLLLPLAWLLSTRKKMRGEKVNLPPGPPGLPILGNLHQLGALLHQSFWKLSKTYGPVMFLKLGRIPTVVITSAEAAEEVLKTNDLACCSRPLSAGSGRLSYNYLDIAFAPYADNWRDMRKLINLELFNLKKVQSFHYIREQEVDLLISSLASSAKSSPNCIVNLTEKLLSLAANITFRTSFGFIYRGTSFDKDRLGEVVHEALAIIGSLGMEECFPIQKAGRIVDRISGRHAWIERIFNELDKFFVQVIDEHMKARNGKKKEEEDMVDVLLGIENDQAGAGGARFTKDNIKSVLLDLLLGGIDTVALAIIWAIAELLRNPRTMRRAQDDVRNLVGKKGRVTESDIDQLEYLQLVIKETLRLHPAGPLLLPRETMFHCKINGYDILPKTLIYVNSWAIGRDPKYWKEPEVFLPERFEDSSLDFRGQRFEYLPFGSGRRSCVGIHMGRITVALALANLLYSFDWKLPGGMKEEDMDMAEKAGFSLTAPKKIDLCLVPISYL